MIVPYRVDVPNDHVPLMNYVLICSIVAVFAWQLSVAINAPSHDEIAKTMEPYILNGWNIKGLFSHMWMHGGIIHVAGNLIFLWVFGNAICGKINNLIYIPMYLFFGLAAAFSHNIFNGGSMVGASGAINGIVGMYLVMFPLNEISCFYLILLRPGVFCISSYWMVLLWFIFDIFGAALGGGGVAHFAHLGGFFAGVGLAITLLKLKIVVMNDRYEKSLLDVFFKKEEGPQVSKSMGMYDFCLQQKEMPKEDSDRVATEKESQQHPSVQTIDENDFFKAEEHIRFKCNCGQKIKMLSEYAGRFCKCPKCSQKVKIPG